MRKSAGSRESKNVPRSRGAKRAGAGRKGRTRCGYIIDQQDGAPADSGRLRHEGVTDIFLAFSPRQPHLRSRIADAGHGVLVVLDSQSHGERPCNQRSLIITAFRLTLASKRNRNDEIDGPAQAQGKARDVRGKSLAQPKVAVILEAMQSIPYRSIEGRPRTERAERWPLPTTLRAQVSV